ncbi:hypothetical protein [Mesorhizobium sp. SP-1A]|uniref:hypothetical protein n=1 Tax=Mesorhizobium sp. SP-1A TaxID=3077840 RepID=UPI0028F728F7|nr:hypothetical protein [Mesorhizobium sp. SP-1A]
MVKTFKRFFARNSSKNIERVQRKNAETRQTFEAMIDVEITLGTRMVEREGDKVHVSVRPTTAVVQDWFDARLYLPKEIDGQSGPQALFVAWLYKLKRPHLAMLFALVSALTARALVEAGFIGMENTLLTSGVIMVALLSLHLTGLLHPKEAQLPDDYDWMIPEMMKVAKRYVLFGANAVYVSSPSTKDKHLQTAAESATRLRVIPYNEIGRVEQVLRGTHEDYNSRDTIVYDKAGTELFRIDRKNSSVGVDAVHFLKDKLAAANSPERQQNVEDE